MIDFTELDGSPNIEVTVDGMRIARRYKVAWLDAPLFVTQIYNTTDVLNSAAVCNQCRIRPHPGENLGTGNYNIYEYAIVEASYSTAATVNVVESFAPSAEFITLDAKNFKWNSDNKALEDEEAPGKLNLTLDYIQSWKNLEFVSGAALELVGTLNNNAFNPSTINPALINLSFPAFTLLYHPPVITRSWDNVNERFAWDVTYRFTYRPNWQGGVARGWNYFWRPGEGTFDYMRTISTNQPVFIYQSANFGALFA